MDRLRTSIHRAAATNLTVLIEGEPGTGKDGVVRALHAGSPRHQGPLVMFDCRNIAPDRVAAALFGHVRGAFADTAGASEGAFRRAHNGTLYIDGICELPMEVQGALLRALDTREIRPVGGGSFIPVNVRVIASTPRSLEHQVSVGHFRKELLFRLAVARVRVPALRHRSEDIATLAEYFARHQGVSVDPAVTDALTHRSYRENVRELRGLVESAALRVGPGATITDIDPPCVDPSDRAAKSAFVVPRTQAPNQARPALASIATIGQRVPASRASMDFHSAKQIAVDAFEREYLAQLLEDCTYNLSEASRRAGVDRGHLRELCRKHDMDPARLRSERAASRAS